MLTGAHHRAARAVSLCRTAALGGQAYECKECDETKYAYHSCNHRSCPQCGGQDQQEWAAAQQAKLLRTRYFMLTVTMPEEMRRFVYQQQAWFYDLFFNAVSSALKDLGADPQHLGGKIGFTAVLHTWTREMQYHPHLHLIIPGVALSKDGLRIKRSKGRKYLFPPGVLNIVFRNRIHKLLLERAAQAKKGELGPTGQPIPLVDLSTIEPSVWTKPWVINAKAVGKGDTALRYLARYVFKSAFSEKRLLGYDEKGRVRLNCQDSKSGRWHEILLEPVEFLRRWSLHVLPKGLVRVRHYGFLSAAGKRSRERVEAILGALKPELPPVEPAPSDAPAEPPKEARIPKCPCCGKAMDWKRELKRLPLWTEPPLGSAADSTPVRGPPPQAQPA